MGTKTTLTFAAIASATAALATLGSGDKPAQVIEGLTYMVEDDGTSVRAPNYNCEDTQCHIFHGGNSGGATIDRIDVRGDAADDFAEYLASRDGRAALEAIKADFEDSTLEVAAITPDGTVAVFDYEGTEINTSNYLSVAFRNLENNDVSDDEAVVLYDTAAGVEAQVVTAYKGPLEKLGFQ
ncbi:MAG: hypothetical protein AAF244_02100 [Pseudomonadota bacterium]